MPDQNKSQKQTRKQDPDLATIVRTTQGSYRVIVGRDVVDGLGLELQKTGQAVLSPPHG